MSYYKHHLFFCLNERTNGEACCASQGAQAAFDHCKTRVKAEDLAGPGGVRVNKAGCLDPVSYTHLDVYKRQDGACSNSCSGL